MKKRVRQNTRNKAISGIIGGAILFAILFTTGATYFSVVQQQNQLMQTTILERYDDVSKLRDEAVTVNVELDESKFMLANVTNDGGFAVRIKELFVVAPNGTMVKHIDTSPLPITINMGTFKVINSTIKHDTGTWFITVVTARGSVATGQYPPRLLPIARAAIEAIASNVTTAAIDNLLLDYASLEMCIPDEDNCEPSSSDWSKGWLIIKNEEILFRVKIRNTGNATYFLSEESVVSAVYIGKSASISANTFHLKEPPTVSDNDGIPYSPDFNIALLKYSESYLYFGAKDSGGDDLQKISTVGLYTLILVIFGWEDVNNDGTYESAIDNVPYAQSLPFQAVVVEEEES